jgi:hypothetical protein
LPATVRRAYRESRLHLLPFPGSLVFWGAAPYRRLGEELPLAMQIPLLIVLKEQAGVNRLRVPQAGWFQEAGPRLADLHGPLRNTIRRPHRPALWFWEEDGEEDSLDEPLARVLCSIRPEDLGLYNKPQARNAQIWTNDFRLLLDGPSASPHQLELAAHLLGLGGRFGYRFQFPAMRVGPFELYWHRPLAACRTPTGRLVLLRDAPLGFFQTRNSELGTKNRSEFRVPSSEFGSCGRVCCAADCMLTPSNCSVASRGSGNSRPC